VERVPESPEVAHQEGDLALGLAARRQNLATFDLDQDGRGSVSIPGSKPATYKSLCSTPAISMFLLRCSHEIGLFGIKRGADLVAFR